MFLLNLCRDCRSVALVHVGFLLRGRPYLNSALTSVEGHVRDVVHNHGLVHVNVSDLGGVHAHDGGIVEKRSAAPFAAAKTAAEISIAVINATVEAHLRAPVPGIPNVQPVIPDRKSTRLNS